MTPDNNQRSYRVVFNPHFNAILCELSRENRDLFRKINKQIDKILKEPTLGKPLRNVLKNKMRVHISSFVLVYEFLDGELRVIDFDHHDKIYKKQF